jgi:hypothetical protein
MDVGESSSGSRRQVFGKLAVPSTYDVVYFWSDRGSFVLTDKGQLHAVAFGLDDGAHLESPVTGL